MQNTRYEVEPYGDHPSQYIERWPNPDAQHTAVLLHGGYWREAYGCDLMHPMAERLNATGWEVLNVEYRRVGQVDAPWAAMRDDIQTMIRHIPDQAVLIGHSAGGHLGLWAAAHPDAPSLAGVVALAPVADLDEADRLELSNHATAELFGDDQAERSRHFLLASPRNLLPLHQRQLVVHGSADINVPKTISDDYVAKAIELGDEVRYIEGADVDHFHIIDPTTYVWSQVEAEISSWV